MCVIVEVKQGQHYAFGLKWDTSRNEPILVCQGKVKKNSSGVYEIQPTLDQFEEPNGGGERSRVRRAVRRAVAVAIPTMWSMCGEEELINVITDELDSLIQEVADGSRSYERKADFMGVTDI